MRKLIWIAMASVTLLASACKKKEEAGREMDRAASSAAKAQENVNDQAKDVYDQQKDVAKDQQKMAKDQADVSKEQRDLNEAQIDLAQARDHYRDAARERLARLDDQIREVETRTDAAAKDAAAKLRVRRDELTARLDTIGAQVRTSWDGFKKDVDERFDTLERDIKDALKK